MSNGHKNYTLFHNAVHPDIALFSTGYRNRYHFPHSKAVERYQQQDITMFNTAAQGAIQFTFNSPLLPVVITTWQSTSRIWRSDATDLGIFHVSWSPINA